MITRTKCSTRCGYMTSSGARAEHHHCVTDTFNSQHTPFQLLVTLLDLKGHTSWARILPPPSPVAYAGARGPLQLVFVIVM